MSELGQDARDLWTSLRRDRRVLFGAVILTVLAAIKLMVLGRWF